MGLTEKHKRFDAMTEQFEVEKTTTRKKKSKNIKLKGINWP
eukprot:UN15902